MQSIKSLYDLKKDNILGTVVVMHSEIAEINEGKMFEANIYASNISNSGTYSAYFTTHATKYMHVKGMQIWSSNPNCKVKGDLYENMTATATGGAVVVAYNKNRNHTDLTSGISISASATVTVGGATLLDKILSNGSLVNYESEKSKWILKPAIKYGIVLQNANPSTATTDISLKMRFTLETEDIG